MSEGLKKFLSSNKKASSLTRKELCEFMEEAEKESGTFKFFQIFRDELLTRIKA